MEGGNGATVGSEVTLRRAESAIGLKGGNAVNEVSGITHSPSGEQFVECNGLQSLFYLADFRPRSRIVFGFGAGCVQGCG